MKTDHLRTFDVPAYSSEVAPRASTMLDRWALARIQSTVRSAPIRFMLWDGFERPPTAGPAVATIVFKNRPALLGWVWDPELNFGEAYMSGAVEIRGDLLKTLEEIYRALGTSTRRPWWLWQKSNDARAARDNVHHHYDLGNEFYRLWLDREMVYTCAYFPTADTTLEEAQIAKMDLVCRKLQLKPGERVIEAGCGWGSLALFMAKHYGVTVRAFNISSEQIAYARNRAKEEGLADRVEFIEDDYRNLWGTCDVFVSIGMLEHVGLPDYPTLGHVIDRSLTDRGRGFLHFIGRNQAAPLNPWIRKRIFPGAYTPTLARGVRPRARTSRVVGTRRREPAVALRQDIGVLAAAFRQLGRPCGGDLRRHVCPRVAALPDRLGSGVHDRLDATVSGGVRARQQQRDPLDAYQRLTPHRTPWTRVMCSSQAAAPLARPARGPFVRRVSTSSSWTGRRFRATRSAPAGSRRTFCRICVLTRTSTSTDGRSNHSQGSV